MNNEQLRSLAIQTGISYDPVTIRKALNKYRLDCDPRYATVRDHALYMAGLNHAAEFLERVGNQMSLTTSPSGFSTFSIEPSSLTPNMACPLTEYAEDGGAFYFVHMVFGEIPGFQVIGNPSAMEVCECLATLREKVDGSETTAKMMVAHWDDIIPYLLN